MPRRPSPPHLLQKPCHCEGAKRPWQSAPPVPSPPLPKGGWTQRSRDWGIPHRTPCNAFVGATLAVARPQFSFLSPLPAKKELPLSAAVPVFCLFLRPLTPPAGAPPSPRRSPTRRCWWRDPRCARNTWRSSAGPAPTPRSPDPGRCIR